MPEGSIPTAAPAAPTTSAPTTTAAPTTTSAPEPKVTWGSPDADKSIQTSEATDVQHAGSDTGTGEGDGFDDFGEEDFGADDSSDDVRREDFGQEAYQKLKTALAADPELFKQVKKAVSENKRFKEIAQTPEILRQSFDRLETLGGLDAVEKESKEWADVYQMFATGDPGVIDYWAKDNPDGLSKIMPAAIDRYEKLDPAGWTHKMASTFMATVHQSGLATALDTLASLDAVSKSPEAKALLTKAINVINAVNAHAEKSPERDLTPDQKKLTEREQNLNQKEAEIYKQSLTTRTVPLMNRIANTAIKAHIRDRKLTPEQQSTVRSDTLLEYARLANKDTAFQDNRRKLLAAGETDKFMKLIEAHMQRTMPNAARTTWRKYTGISGLSSTEQQQRRTEAQSRTEAGGGGTTQGMVKTGPPDPRTVDWARMREEMGRDKADEAFSFGVKGTNGGKRFYYKKGDPKGVYTF